MKLIITKQEIRDALNLPHGVEIEVVDIVNKIQMNYQDATPPYFSVKNSTGCMDIIKKRGRGRPKGSKNKK